MKLCIKEATDNDLKAILSVVRAAFEASEESEEVAQLVKDALDDPTALPSVSLLAFVDSAPAGYILFTKARLNTHPEVRVALLAPLAVIPAFQRQGVGGRLIEEGIKMMEQQNVELVFVSGHPSYYPRHGFRCAGDLGFGPPYPDDHPDAWMLRELCSGAIDRYAPAKLMCAKSLDRPDYWQGPPSVRPKE